MAFDPSKTEKATPKRREELRNKGQVARSMELNAATTFIIAIVVLRLFGGYFLENIQNFTSYLWNELPVIMDSETAITIIRSMLISVLNLIIPFSITLLVVAIVISIFQVGWHPTLYPLKPDITKINPIGGFKRFISLQPYVMLLQNIVKITIMTIVAYIIFKNNYPLLLETVNMDINQTGLVILKIVWEISWKLAFLMLILAIIDFVWQRYYFERSIKMTKQEIKDEVKQAEGDPQIKSRIKKKQRELAVLRMMQAIPKADVVVTNPVHLAIALQYDSMKMSAPCVVAKGAGRIAERIKEVARENNIPIIENKPLAQSLFKMVEIGEEIPEELYTAVSEILVYVYQLSGRL